MVTIPPIYGEIWNYSILLFYPHCQTFRNVIVPVITVGFHTFLFLSGLRWIANGCIPIGEQKKMLCRETVHGLTDGEFLDEHGDPDLHSECCEQNLEHLQSFSVDEQVLKMNVYIIFTFYIYIYIFAMEEHFHCHSELPRGYRWVAGVLG